MLKIKQIEVKKRLNFRTKEHMEEAAYELVSSILLDGLLHLPSVVKVPDGYDLVAGGTRFYVLETLAEYLPMFYESFLITKDSLPVSIQSGDPMILSFMENMSRIDLSAYDFSIGFLKIYNSYISAEEGSSEWRGQRLSLANTMGMSVNSLSARLSEAKGIARIIEIEETAPDKVLNETNFSTKKVSKTKILNKIRAVKKQKNAEEKKLKKAASLKPTEDVGQEKSFEFLEQSIFDFDRQSEFGLIIADPPYLDHSFTPNKGEVRTYEHSDFNYPKFLKICYNALKEYGVFLLFTNSSIHTTIKLVAHLNSVGFVVSNCPIIMERPTGSGMGKINPISRHEQVLICCKDHDEVIKVENPLPSVIKVKQGQVTADEKDAEFLLKLMRTYTTNEDEKILDPTIGSGSTFLAGQMGGFKNITGIEISPVRIKLVKSLLEKMI